MHSFFNYLVYSFTRKYEILYVNYIKSQLGYVAKDVILGKPATCTCPSKVFLYERTNIYSGARFIISKQGQGGRFIMKKNSGAAQGLTVITGNHSFMTTIGSFHKDEFEKRIGDIDNDVIIEEDVWIGANVTLCSGVTVGRGAIVGAGSVIRNSIPPYAIVYGNPAKVTSFKYTVKEIVKHESLLYEENERIPIEKLQKNYEKYFLKRIRYIKEYIQI